MGGCGQKPTCGQTLTFGVCGKPATLDYCGSLLCADCADEIVTGGWAAPGEVMSLEQAKKERDEREEK
jgi:hypothetical protein